MIDARELRSIARARLNDAEHLLRARRYDSGAYLCGYAVELALKARICKALKWSGYPGTSAEFRGYQSFRTHDLAVLLRLSGREAKVTGTFGEEWRDVEWWTPDVRYRGGKTTRDDLAKMIESTRRLLRAL
ncbi:MAG: HEPN domain-containing protein [Longimicrobiales bacterium]